MSIEVIILMIVYPIGFLLALTFFKFFGETIGMGGYDPPHESDYDDWESNSHAFLAFSMGWFVVIPLMLIAGIFILLLRFSKWSIQL